MNDYQYEETLRHAAADARLRSLRVPRGDRDEFLRRLTQRLLDDLPFDRNEYAWTTEAPPPNAHVVQGRSLRITRLNEQGDPTGEEIDLNAPTMSDPGILIIPEGVSMAGFDGWNQVMTIPDEAIHCRRGGIRFPMSNFGIDVLNAAESPGRPITPTQPRGDASIRTAFYVSDYTVDFLNRRAAEEQQ